MMVDCGRRILFLVLAAGLLTGPSPLVLAQTSQGIVNVFVPADRSLRQHLLRAGKAIQEERFSDAVHELGILLASPSGAEVAAGGETTQDFFLDVSAQAGTRTSVKTEAERLLGTLPLRGRELYELQFGSAARALLDQAVAENNLEKLHEVTRRYFLTKAGGEAALLLGRLYLDSGRPLAAALCLKRLADHPSVARDFDPEISILLAACWYQARQPDKAQQILEALQVRQPRAQLKIGGSDAEPLPAPDQALAWLARHFGSSRDRETHLDQWTLYRGNEARNAKSRGGLPLDGFRWRQRLAGSPRDQQIISELQQNFSEQNMAAIPAMQPVAVGNVLLMRTPDLLLAIDVETGKVVWPYPWEDVLSASESDAQAVQARSNERGDRKDLFAHRIWQDAPYGQVSSDGESVYLLDNLRQMLTPRQWIGRRGMMLQMPESDSHNELVALELKREGAFQWRVGGQAGGEEPQLAGAMFLGPPLPLFGHLYVLAEMRGEIRLVVLDSPTGRLRWSQQLAHIEPAWGGDYNVRRYAGATPSFADGVLVCPTSSGAVVAVDISARRLLWGYQFTQSLPMTGNFGFMQPVGPSFQASISRWVDATATIAEGCVILTPPESESLICLDLLTGQPRWPPLPRQGDLAEMLYVACVHDGNIVLIGKDRAAAIRIRDGKPAWNQPIAWQADLGEMPSGRGFQADGFYFLPTTASQLVKIDLKQGKIAERQATAEVLGNLICFKDDVISLSPDGATTYFQIEPLRARVADRLNKNGDDAWALARQGELLVHDGKHGEALSALQRAYRLAPEDQAVRALLVHTFLTALRQDFVQHQGLAKEIEPLIENDPQRIEYLLMTADGYRGVGEFANAAESYVKLTQLLMSERVNGSEPFPVIARGSSWSVRLDRFISARLDELSRSADPAVRDAIDRLVDELDATACRRGTPEMNRFLHLCGFHPAADGCRLAYAGRLIDAGQLLEAELVLAAIGAESPADKAGQADALRARLFAQTRDMAALTDAYERLRTRWSATPVWEGKTGKDLFADAVAKGLIKPDPDDDAWPWGRTTHQQTTEAVRAQQAYRRPLFIPVTQHSGSRDRNLRVVFDGMNPLHVRDGHGETIIRFNPLEANLFPSLNVHRAEADGHLLWFSLGGQLHAVSLLGGRANAETSVLWREYLFALPTEAGTTIPRAMPRKTLTPFDPVARETYYFEDAPNRPIAVTGPMNRVAVCFQKVRTVTCVDPLTGKVAWSRNDLEPGLDLLGDSRFIVAIPQGSTEAVLLDAVDGRNLGRRSVPAEERRWAECGVNILTWDDGAEGWRLRLWDVAEQRDVWSQSSPAGTRGYVIENHAVAMVLPDWRFIMRSLHDDRILIDTQLEPGMPVESIHVRASQNAYLLIVNDSHPMPRETELPRYLSNQSLTQVNGRLYSFDRGSGAPLWFSPAVVRGYYMPTEQPEEVPTLWLIRPYRQGGAAGQAQALRTDVACLDRRTGALLLDLPENSTPINSFEVVAVPAKREVNFLLPQIMFTMRFTDEPRPPAPPAQLGTSLAGSPSALDSVKEFIENVTEAIPKLPTPATPEKGGGAPPEKPPE